MIRLRQENPIIVYGTYTLILDDHPEIYAFTRTWAGERLLVALNFTKSTPVFELPAPITFFNQQLLLSNYEVDPAEDIHRLNLRSFEARLPAAVADAVQGSTTASLMKISLIAFGAQGEGE